MGLSKQYEILSNAADPIWFYKTNIPGQPRLPNFSTDLPRECRISLNSENCGLFLNLISDDNLNRFLTDIDDRIQTIDLESTGEIK